MSREKELEKEIKTLKKQHEDEVEQLKLHFTSLLNSHRWQEDSLEESSSVAMTKPETTASDSDDEDMKSIDGKHEFRGVMVRGRKKSSLAAKQRRKEIVKQQAAALAAAAPVKTTAPVSWVSPSTLNTNTTNSTTTDTRKNWKEVLPLAKQDLKLKDGTKLKSGNVLKLYPGLYNRTSDFGEDGRKCRAMIGKFLPRLLSNLATREMLLNLPQDALRALLQYDNLAVSVEYDLLCLTGAWCDKQLDSVTLSIYDTAKNNAKPAISEDSLFADILVWHKKKGSASSGLTGMDDEKKPLAIGKNKPRAGSETESSSGSESDPGFPPPAPVAAPPPPGTSTEANTEKNKVEIRTLIQDLPEWKKTDEYKNHLRKKMDPLMDHIRFPMMSLKYLERIEDSGLVDRKYLTEAYKYLVMSKGKKFSDKNNERFRKRVSSSLFSWDKTRKGTSINVTDDVCVNKTSTCSHSSILTKQGMTSGVERWSIRLKANAGCYSAVGIATSAFMVDGNILGVAPNSWGYAMYVGMGNLGQRRIQTSSTVQAGTVVTLEFDRNDSKITVFENSVQKGTLAGVNPPHGTPVYFALTICHNTPQEEYTLMTGED